MNTATIQLTRGVVALVDAELAPALSAFRWAASPRSRPAGTFYAARGPRIEGEPGTVYMHRVVAGAKRGQIVDHINGDTLDNRRCNLRLCTASQNSANSAARRGVSGFRGVTASSNAGGRPWRACIFVNRQKFNIGYYDSPEEAALAYDVEAVRRFGEFAVLNFPADGSLRVATRAIKE